MSLPVFDKALVILIVLAGIIATDSSSRADPAPDECDEFCRERRFFKNRDAAGATTCVIWKYRHCILCEGGRCFGNAAEDKLTNGNCEDMTVKQELPKVLPEKCNAMCSFPVAPGATRREAVEGPTTYSDIMANNWLESPSLVTKCYIQDQPFKVWSDENVDAWQKKKKID